MFEILYNTRTQSSDNDLNKMFLKMFLLNKNPNKTADNTGLQHLFAIKKCFRIQ